MTTDISDQEPPSDVWKSGSDKKKRIYFDSFDFFFQ